MTSAQLLELFNDLTGRATTDSIGNPKKYTWLARAEQEVISEIATIRPDVLYPKVGTSSLPTMSTTDANVFTFGLDANNDRIMPIGNAQIYKRTTDVPDRPLREGWDFINEGDQIRLPRGRTYTSTLYYRGLVMPALIGATENPHLLPGPMNELTAIRAARNFAESGNLRNAALADRMNARFRSRFPYWCLVLKRQFSSGGALATLSARDLVTPLL